MHVERRTDLPYNVSCGQELCACRKGDNPTIEYDLWTGVVYIECDLCTGIVCIQKGDKLNIEYEMWTGVVCMKRGGHSLAQLVIYNQLK